MLKKLKQLLVKQRNGTAPQGTVYRPPLWSAEAHVSHTIAACVNAIIARATVPTFTVLAGDTVHTEAQTLLDRPDGVMPWRDWYAVLLRNMLVEGNAYAALQVAGDTRTWIIFSPKTAQVLVDDYNRIVGYEFATARGRLRFAETDVLHLGFWYPTELPGLSASPLDLLSDIIAADRALTEYLTALLQNFGTPSVIYTYKGNTFLGEEQWRALDAYFKEHFQGSRRGSVAVLRVPFDVHTLGGLPEGAFRDYLFAIESRICSLYRVPAQVAGVHIGYQFSTYANYDAALRSFVDNTILPILRQTEWQLYKVLRSHFPDITDVTADYSELLPLPSQEERARIATSMAQLYTLGVVTVNEVREAIGLEPIEAEQGEAELTEPEERSIAVPELDLDAENIEEKSLALYWKAWDTLMHNGSVRLLREIRSVLHKYEEELVALVGGKQGQRYEEKAAFSLAQLLEQFVTEASERTRAIAARYMLQAAQQSRDVVRRFLRKPVDHVVQRAVESAVETVNSRARVSFANFAQEMRALVWQLWGSASIGEVVQAIRAKFSEYSLIRARMAARTRIRGGITRAQRETWEGIAQEHNMRIRRMWVSMRDERVRDSHREMDGRLEDDDGLFTLPNGLRGEGPGLFDDPGESINCRCTTRPRRVG